MKRIGAVVVLLILSAAGLLWPVIVASIPASSSAASDPVSIVDYSARYDIQVDGHLSAVETITAQFPSGRHGIFRYWDVTNPTDSGARQIPTVSSVTLDGRDVPVEYSTESAERYVVAKIGDPNSYVSQGVHVYEISYTVEGVIDPPSAGAGDFATVVGDASASAQSVFYWNVVAPGWEMPIRQANVVVTLPAPSGRVECSADDRNAQPCAVGGEGTDVVTIAASDLDPRQPVTVRIGMNLPAPARDILPWSSSFDKVLGRSPAVATLVGLLGLIGLAAGWVWARAAHEPEPGFPVMYAPPEGIGPVQANWIHSESFGSTTLSSSFLHMAQQGVVTLRQQGTEDWRIVGNDDGPGWSRMDRVTVALGACLGVTRRGAGFSADGSVSAGKTLSSAKALTEAECKAWGRDEHLVVSSKFEYLGACLVVLAFVLAIVGFVGWLAPTMAGVPFAAFVIGGRALTRPGTGTRRTARGREVWSRTGGFRRLLSTPSSVDRFDFSARADMYTAFVPYAVGFGVAEQWAKKFRDATGTEPPTPTWYPVTAGTSHGFLGSGTSFDSFDSALSSSISSYEATQSSSSSSSGGGGGGGGSW